MNWQTIYNENGIEASVLIEDGKPVRLSVSPADYEGNEVEEVFDKTFPQYELDTLRWDSPSGEDCVVCPIEDKGEYPIGAVADGVTTRLIKPLPVGVYYYCVRYGYNEFDELPGIPLDVLWPAGFDGEIEYSAKIDRAKLLPLILRPASWDESGTTKSVVAITCEHFSLDPEKRVACDCESTDAVQIGHWS